jgi:hypothetical protein
MPLIAIITISAAKLFKYFKNVSTSNQVILPSPLTEALKNEGIGTS